MMESVVSMVTAHPVVTSIFVVFTLAFAYLAGVFDKRYKNAPPMIRIGLPVIGNFLGFAKSPVGFIAEANKKFGDVFTMKMFNQRLTFLIGPDAHNMFFRASEDEASQAEVYKFMTPVFGPGIVYDAPIKVRVQQMKFVSGSLKAGQLKSYIPKITGEAEAYFDKWADSGEVNLLEALSELTILTASRCLMGREVRENMFEQVAKLYSDLDGGITPLTVFYPSAPTPAHRRRDAARAEMAKIFSKVIKQRRQSGSNEDDCLQAFMNCSYKDGSKLSDDSITGMMIALLFAGQHTSSITSTWTTLFVLHNPEILKNVIAEQEAVLGSLDPAAPITWESLQQMDLLHRCIKEALRMWPPLIFLMRKLKKDTKVGDVTVPAGDTIMAAPSVSMRLESVFKNPDTFDPDRYLPPRAEDQQKPFSFIGFGGGIHGCMGEQFAYVQVKTIISVMLRRYRLKTVLKSLPEPDYKAMVVGPKSKTTMVEIERIAPRNVKSAGSFVVA